MIGLKFSFETITSLDKDLNRSRSNDYVLQKLVHKMVTGNMTITIIIEQNAWLKLSINQ